MKIEIIPKTIKCNQCKEESYIGRWGVNVINDKLCRVCPICLTGEIIG